MKNNPGILKKKKTNEVHKDVIYLVNFTNKSLIPGCIKLLTVILFNTLFSTDHQIGLTVRLLI